MTKSAVVHFTAQYILLDLATSEGAGGLLVRFPNPLATGIHGSWGT